MNLSPFAAGSIVAFCLGMPSAIHAQECPDGQAPFSLHVHTDGWGYEAYWALTPEGVPCGEDALYWGGNAQGVGCDGEGDAEATEGEYASNTTFIEDALCGVIGEPLTLHHVDSYGDGGTQFEVYVDGALMHSFAGTGAGNVWTFNPFQSVAPAYDSPCGAVDIEVDGPMVLVSNDSCSAAYQEPGAPAFGGVYSCQINGGWCEGGVTGSAWLSFVAPSSNCWISACNDTTNFDTQLALWKAEDCLDFDTYELIAANDDLPGGCGTGAFYASGMWTGCLDSGATYLIQLDGWQNARGLAGVTIETSVDEPTVTSSTGGLDCALDKAEDPDGTIVLNVSGTGSNYTAAWIGPNNFNASGQQISNLSPGTYSAVLLTSCGTSLTHSVTLVQPESLNIGLELVPPGCPELPNGEAFLDANGGTEPYEITWSGSLGEVGSGPMVEGLLEGTYAVALVDDNGCEAGLTFELLAEDDAFAFNLGADTTICEDDQLVLSAPAGLDYLWSTGSEDQFIVVDAETLGPGTYPFTVEASNAFGCSHADAIFITVFDCTSSVIDAGPFALKAHPNPTNGAQGWKISSVSSEAGTLWQLRDAQGRRVQQGKTQGQSAGPWEVPSAGLGAGIYTLKIEGVPPVRLIKN